MQTGSDHDVYQDSSFGIPAIYLNDWPDRYIHTNFDAAANIDATKLKRAAFIGAASGYFLANFSRQEIGAAKAAIDTGKLMRAPTGMDRQTVPAVAGLYERNVLRSVLRFSQTRLQYSSPEAGGRAQTRFAVSRSRVARLRYLAMTISRTRGRLV